MKRCKILWIVLLSTTVWCSNLYAQTLEESLKIAAENNPLLKAAYSEFEAAMQNAAKVNSLPDPTLSFGYFISPVETRVGPQRAKIGLSQMFPWFGTLKSAENVQKLRAEAKYQDFLNTRNELYMRVKSAWFPMYSVHRKIALQEKNKRILSSYKQLATTGFKNNKNSMVDVIRVDIMIENTETEIKLLKDNLKPLTIAFNTLLNRDEMLPVAIPDSISIPEIEITTNYGRDSLLENHPLLQSLELKIQSAKEAEQLAQKQGLPKFGIGLDYVVTGKRTDMTVSDNGKNVVMPMVSMSLPIYRGKYKAAVKEAQFNRESMVNYRTNTQNTLVSNYEMALFELEKSGQLIALYKRQIHHTQRAIRLLETAYSNSGKDFEEVLRMQQQLIKYQMDIASETTALYVALAKLDYLTSKIE